MLATGGGDISKKFYRNNIDSSFKNSILMTFFTQEKATLVPEKGHLAKLGGPGLVCRKNFWFVGKKKFRFVGKVLPLAPPNSKNMGPTAPLGFLLPDEF